MIPDSLIARAKEIISKIPEIENIQAITVNIYPEAPRAPYSSINNTKSIIVEVDNALRSSLPAHIDLDVSAVIGTCDADEHFHVFIDSEDNIVNPESAEALVAIVKLFYEASVSKTSLPSGWLSLFDSYPLPLGILSLLLLASCPFLPQSYPAVVWMGQGAALALLVGITTSVVIRGTGLLRICFAFLCAISLIISLSGTRINIVTTIVPGPCVYKAIEMVEAILHVEKAKTPKSPAIDDDEDDDSDESTAAVRTASGKSSFSSLPQRNLPF